MTDDADEHQPKASIRGSEDVQAMGAYLIGDERALHEFPESLRLFYDDPNSPEAFAAKERYLEMFNSRLEAGCSEYSRKMAGRLRMPNESRASF